jgi:mRNA interferase MazF
MRPAVVVNRDALGILALRVVAPVTGWQDRFQGSDWLVRIDPDSSNNLDKSSAVDTFSSPLDFHAPIRPPTGPTK